jgi:hypothetical protein
LIANFAQKRNNNVVMEENQSHLSGRLRIGLLFLLAFIAATIYTGIQLVPYWITASEMQDFLSEATRTAELTSDETLRTSVLAKANQLGLTLSDQDIEINRSSRALSISATWQMDYNFFGLYTHPFIFSPHATFRYQ